MIAISFYTCMLAIHGIYPSKFTIKQWSFIPSFYYQMVVIYSCFIYVYAH